MPAVHNNSDFDGFYVTLRQAYDDADGVIILDWVSRVQTLLYVLDDTGLREDAERFRALLP